MSAERDHVITFLEEKIKSLENKVVEDQDALGRIKDRVEWRQKKVKGFKEVLEELK
ncbi:hypothetical protein LCGC14_0566750 [marine sediment metagenome]|uniref:Uncharacterized protein n=1 Tax=marine sediment metagenome TaxID=412755 RepID=A0A0F9UTJ5_9ZZZZ